LGAMVLSRVTLSDSNGAEQVGIAYSTPGFDETFGIQTLLGRVFLPEEGEPGKDHVVALSYELWRDRFGSDPNILGKKIRLDREPYTVVGVYRPAPTERVVNSRIRAPLAFKREQIRRDIHPLLVEGRLKPGVTLAEANANMEVIVRRIAETYPETSKDWGVRVEALQNAFLDKNLQSALFLLMGAVGFVLLIACANVANLLLARGTARQREVAVRGALGATRGQVIRQFLAESLSLAAIGGVLGVGLAWGLVKIIMVLVPQGTLPMDKYIGLQAPVLLFTVAVTMISSVLFGSAPAWQAARLDLNEALKQGGHSSRGVSRHGLRRALVVAEFALALTLLAGGGVALHSFWKLAHVDLGFRKDHVLTFFLPLRQGQLTTPEQMTSHYRELLDEFAAVPGVSVATAATGMPVYGPGFRVPFSVAGRAVGDPASRPTSGFCMVTPGYFRTFGIRLSQGRTFTEEDIAGGTRVAMINESFAKEYLSGVDPLMQRLVVEELIPGTPSPGPPVEWQVVGVFQDVRNRGLRGEEVPEIEVPFWQSPWPWAGIAVRTSGDPAGVSKSIAATLRAMDPDLPMTQVETMDQVVDESMDAERFEATLFGSFSGIALLLAALGIYGVMAFAVAQRTHEIGVRMALGAGRSHVLNLVLKEGMVLASAGLVLGLGGAFFVGGALRSRLYGIGAIDPTALGSVAAVLLVAALLACYVPAWRATKIDPIVALHEE